MRKSIDMSVWTYKKSQSSRSLVSFCFRTLELYFKCDRQQANNHDSETQTNSTCYHKYYNRDGKLPLVLVLTIKITKTNKILAFFSSLLLVSPSYQTSHYITMCRLKKKKTKEQKRSFPLHALYVLGLLLLDTPVL